MVASAPNLTSAPANGAATHERQLGLFGDAPPDSWELLRTRRLPLDGQKYRRLVEAYRDIYESFLPGPNAKPFFTQVAEALANEQPHILPEHLASLVRNARRLGVEDFPDPLKRTTIPASSPQAKKLRTPRAPLRMTPKEHNAFARIYRELQKDGYPKRKKKGKGFFNEAAARMTSEGFSFTSKNLAVYASYRRRIGDVNFPRLRGSHELDRMHVAALDRIQSLGVMATGLMHEILQPLQIVVGAADLQRDEARSGNVDKEKLCQRMDQIIAQVNKLSGVVQHVRTLARAGEPKIEAVNLRSCIENALLLFMKQLDGKGIQLDRTGVPEDLPLISADGISIERIFINLITNARDAIDDTGRGEGLIGISARAKDAFVVCDVADNGTGILQENLSRIFDPYFTTKEVGKGTGMGLSEVMNLMIQFGGQVTVASEAGKSTTFTLEFPKHAETS